MNVGRLQNVIRALRECRVPDKFTMIRIMHPCGTPGCALGQYAARIDLQDAFHLKEWEPGDWEAIGIVDNDTGYSACYDGEALGKHFELPFSQMEELFGANGCDGAQTPEDAAVYIEWFIEEMENVGGKSGREAGTEQSEDIA